jgi:RHS repeat-associated protein
MVQGAMVTATGRQSRPVLSVAGSVRLSSDNRPTTYTYDANGNTLAQQTPTALTTFTWDAENRLTGVDGPEGSETYTYDSSTSVPGKVTGRRRSKTTSQGTRYFVWDQQNLLAELDEHLATLARYTDFPGVWGGLSAVRAGQTSQFFGFDLSANTRLALDAGGNVSERALYSAFGPVVAGGLSGPYGFGGQVGYYHDALNRHYVRARHLDVGLGRWLSPDPIGDAGGWPVYGYVGNGPVGAWDASGLYAVPPGMVAPNGPCLWAPGVDILCLAYGAGLGRRLAEANVIAFKVRNRHLIGPVDLPDDISDAFRHCVWQCYMTRTLGAWCARLAGHLHEITGFGGQEMDWTNNWIARRLVAANPQVPCVDLCERAAFTREFVVVRGRWAGRPPNTPPLWSTFL